MAAVVTASLAAGMMPQTANAFAGGDGTSSNPYQIATCAQLQSLHASAYAAAHLVLTADIDCSSTVANPIDFSGSAAYSGTFDGQGHSISHVGLASEGPGTALFVSSNGATFKNLTLVDFESDAASDAAALVTDATATTFTDITVRDTTIFGYYGNVGAVAGKATDSTFTNITVKDVTVADEYGSFAGGVVGKATNSTITNARVTGLTITGEGISGGIVGQLMLTNAGSDASLTHSSAAGTITVTGEYAGGLIGHLFTGHPTSDTLVEQVYSTVNVTSTSHDAATGRIGGLIGSIETNRGTSVVQDAYAWGDVNAEFAGGVGGLIGYMENTGTSGNAAATTVQRVYASGAVTANGSVGGLIGVIKDANNSYNVYILKDSFAKGTVASDDDILPGGLIGDLDESATISSGNYYDRTGTNQAACSSSNVLAGCTAVNTDGTQGNYFINNHANAPMTAWDFSNIWVANSTTPPTFGVTPVAPEDDNDGIDAATENAAPHNGDGNGDGIADSEQANVTSLISPVSGTYVTLAVDDSCELSNVSIANTSSHSVKDAVYMYNSGFVDFTATGCDDGEAHVKLYYHDVAPTGLVARKYNPNTSEYFTISSATIATAPSPLSGTLVSYTVVDNQQLDINPAEGVITDPVGLGSQAVSAPNTGFARRVSTPYLLALIGGLLVLLAGLIVHRKTQGKVQ